MNCARIEEEKGKKEKKERKRRCLKEKGKSATLMEQVEELASENEKRESLAQSKTIPLEEETKKWTE